jgi:hypothetical protein
LVVVETITNDLRGVRSVSSGLIHRRFDFCGVHFLTPTPLIIIHRAHEVLSIAVAITNLTFERL